MACVLTKSDLPGVAFEGPAGTKFTINATVAQGLIGIVSAVYGPTGNPITIHAGNPFTFTVLQGTNTLSILGQATVGSVDFDIVEVCPQGGNNVLHDDVLSPSGHFMVAFEIEGV